MDRSRRNHRADRKNRKKWGKRLLLTALVLLLLFLLSLVGVFAYTYTHIDYTMDEALFEMAKGSRTSRLYYSAPEGVADSLTERLEGLSLFPQERGALFSHLPAGYRPVEMTDQRIYGAENGIFCEYEEIPTHLKNAFVAIEDHRFFSHEGVDWLRTVKACANYFLHFDARFGASTITQQLIKNISSDDEISASRKLREICRAIHLESNHTKEEILALYLNIVPLSRGCIGVGAAAEVYYGKKVGELSLSECAAIAAVTNLPRYYDPVTQPENNRARRRLILDQMWAHGMIGEEEYRRAKEEEPVLRQSGEAEEGQVYRWYTETVITDVAADLQATYGLSHEAAMRMLLGGGLSIYTAQDIRVQTLLEDYFADLSHFPNDCRQGLQYAMSITDPKSGRLLGVVGGVGKKRENRILNYATQVTRAPGSALKPLSVYAPALEEGVITWASVFDDVPVLFSESGGSYTAWPHNSPAVYSGLCDVRGAVVHSKNTVAVRVLDALGVERSYAYLTHRLGLDTLVRSRKNEEGGAVTDLAAAPLALGQLSDGVSVRALTSAYGALADGGVYHSSYSYVLVLDKNGEVLLSPKREGKRVFRETTAAIMTELLRGVTEEGTAKALTLPRVVDTAGKTGTSGDNHDKWFVGYTPYAVSGIWCGYADGRTPIPAAYQATHLAAWDAVMQRIHRVLIEEGEGRSFSLPSGVVRSVYCRDSGGLPCEACRADPRGGRLAIGYFEAGSEPHALCERHILVRYDRQGRGVACRACPHGACEEVGMLLAPERSFPAQVYVTDAQYVFFPTGEGEAWPEEQSCPFFRNALPKGRFVGISRTGDGMQFNAACADHRGDAPYPEEEPPRDTGERGRFSDWLGRRFGFFR